MSGKMRKLTSQEIYEKDFKVAMRGYNQEEVDKFLDAVIHDYESYEAEITELKKEVMLLRQKSSEVQTRPTTLPVANTNPDILKRLSNLEKHVFGSKLYED